MNTEHYEQYKKALLDALENSLGVVTTACQEAGIGRTTFYEYYKSDPVFKEQVDELQNVALDFAESQLFKNIKGGSDAATIFFLKTRGKGRGYIERSEFTGKDGVDLYRGISDDDIKERIRKTLEKLDD